MASPALRAVAACLFFAAAGTSRADTAGAPAAPVPTGLEAGDPGPADSLPEFVRGRAPTPEQLKLLHESLKEEEAAAAGSRRKRALLIAGAASFAGAYLVTAALTGLGNGLECIFAHDSPGCGGERALFIPVVGPVLHLAQSNHVGACVFGPVLVVSSLAQLTGLTLLVVGAVIPGSSPSRPAYSLAPYFSPGGGGLQALVRY